MGKLVDKHILVTRPAGLHHNLCHLLQQAGAIPIHHAAIEIAAPEDERGREYAKQHLDEFDIAIFISPTAVNTTLQYLKIENSRCQLASIGSRSQQALENAGLKVTIQPEGHDSESLLRNPALQADRITGNNIVIFRGEDGRDILGDSLQKRGAKIHYAAMYSRIRPSHDRALDTAFVSTLDAIIISSNEGLQNIYDMATEADTDSDRLLATPLFVPGQRAETLALKLGFKHIIRAQNATDDAMITALENASIL